MRLGRIDHGGPNRVEFDIAHHPEQVRLGIDQAGFVAALPQRADASVALVESLHVGLSDRAHGAGCGTRLLGMQQQVHMVVHEDVCVDQDAVIHAGFAQQAPVVVPILIVKEDRATVEPKRGQVHLSGCGAGGCRFAASVGLRGLGLHCTA